jgi:hypothetical protein
MKDNTWDLNKFTRECLCQRRMHVQDSGPERDMSPKAGARVTGQGGCKRF